MALDKLITGKKSTLHWVLIAVVAIVVITVLYQVYTALKGGSQDIGKILGDKAVADKLQLPQERVSFIREKANDLWANSSGSTWTWLWLRRIDKEAFIAAINSMNDTRELGWLDEAYKQAGGIHLIKSMTGGFINFFDSDIARLTDGYYSFLKR